MAVKVVTIHAKEAALVAAKQVVEESAAVVQDVKQHAKAHVNSVVRVEIDINYNSYGKRHFISSRVFQELIQKSITDFSGKRIVITAHTPIRT